MTLFKDSLFPTVVTHTRLFALKYEGEEGQFDRPWKRLRHWAFTLSAMSPLYVSLLFLHYVFIKNYSATFPYCNVMIPSFPYTIRYNLKLYSLTINRVNLLLYCSRKKCRQLIAVHTNYNKTGNSFLRQTILDVFHEKRKQIKILFYFKNKMRFDGHV